MTIPPAVIRAHAARLPLPDASVDLIVTSPPYFGLRSYTDGGEHYAGQIGSEATPGEWLDALLACTREWVRVLKPEGSLFVNLGDKYAGSQPSAARWHTATLDGGRGRLPELADTHASTPDVGWGNTREKSLLGLPWRYAIGCTDHLGLILRAEIIWAKPNGLPESVTDRVRRAHEQVFHFTRQPRYYSAVDEIREPQVRQERPCELENRWTEHARAARSAGNGAPGHRPHTFNPLGKLPGSVWSIPSQPLQVPAHVGVDHFAAFPMELPRRLVLGWSPPGVCTRCGQGRRPIVDKTITPTGQIGGSRNVARRDLNDEGGHGYGKKGYVLGLTTATITGHVCDCTPYTDHPGTGETAQRRDYNPGPDGYSPQGTYGRKQAGEYERVGPWREYHFAAWRPPPTRPALVVDPFGGTGTTALVASVLGRHGITADLSADYCRLAAWRTTNPGERARAMQVPKPPPVVDGQEALFAL